MNKIKKNKVALFVLGSHRSGTSMITRILNLSGWGLPHRLIPPQKDSNEKGFWEPQELVELNKFIMKELNLSWDTTLVPDSERLASLPREYHDTAQNLLIHFFEKHTHVVLKDPRLCIVFPFWLQECRKLGLYPIVLSIIRSPVEVADSLWKRNGTPRPYGALMWLNHVLAAEKYSRGLPRVYCSYPAVLRDWKKTLTALSTQLADHWPQKDVQEDAINAFISLSERHNVSTDNDVNNDKDMNEWVRDAYSIFRKWGEEGEQSKDMQLLDDIREKFRLAMPALQPLVNALDLDKRRRPSTAALEMNRHLQKALFTAEEKVMELQRVLQKQKDIIKRNQIKYSLLMTEYKNETNKIKIIYKTFSKKLKNKSKEIEVMKNIMDITDKRLESLEREGKIHAERHISAFRRIFLREFKDNANGKIIKKMKKDCMEFGVFDEAWYKEKYMKDANDGYANKDPFEYFINVGLFSGHLPNKLLHDVIWSRRMIRHTLKLKEENKK